jgi:hypothetical protein
VLISPASPLRINNDDNQDFADRTIARFEKLFPAGAILSAILAGLMQIMPGARYYTGSRYAAIGSLLSMINVLLCAACSYASISYRQHLKKYLQAGGVSKFLVNAMSLLVQLLFLTGVLFYFLVMTVVAFVPGIVGVSITACTMVAATSLWVVQSKNSDKSISLPEEE